MSPWRASYGCSPYHTVRHKTSPEKGLLLRACLATGQAKIIRKFCCDWAVLPVRRRDGQTPQTFVLEKIARDGERGLTVDGQKGGVVANLLLLF